MDRAAGYLWGTQSSQDKATTTSLSAANPLPAKLRLQSQLTRLGLTLQIRMGQGLFPIPKFQNKANSSEGFMALAWLKTRSVSGVGGHLPLGRGAPSHTKVGFRSSLKFTTGWAPPWCSVC